MKKRWFEKILFFFWIMLGCFAGYGMVRFAGIGKEDINNKGNVTEDNTLDKEKDSVFFVSEKETTDFAIVLKEEPQKKDIKLQETVYSVSPVEQEIVLNKPEQLKITVYPTITITPIEKTERFEEKELTEQTVTLVPTPEPSPKVEEVVEYKVDEVKTAIGRRIAEEKTEREPIEQKQEQEVEEEVLKEEIKQEEEVITYPMEIFGQTPVVNRSDEYVTYFEFALDLINLIETEVKEKNLQETALFTKFVVKALFCGVDVKMIKINEPIPRSQAALAVWLAGEVMEKEGTDTSSSQVVSYVTDIEHCSNSEKKAIAYLYEQKIISGYEINGQTFFPSEFLKTKDGVMWMENIKQCWN